MSTLDKTFDKTKTESMFAVNILRKRTQKENRTSHIHTETETEQHTHTFTHTNTRTNAESITKHNTNGLF